MDARVIPAHTQLEQFDKLARDLAKAYSTGDPTALRRIQDFFNFHQILTWKFVRQGVQRRLRRLHQFRVRKGKFPLLNRLGWLLKKSFLRIKGISIDDSRLLIAYEFGFTNWSKFAHHIEELNREGSLVSKFEKASDAIIEGDDNTLMELLHGDTELIHARSTRMHACTLLHYISANGVEDYRQKTPKNAVAIAEILIKAGADVNSESESYGGRSTTLGLVATSIHPLVAGVQIDLLEVLLQNGAIIDNNPEYNTVTGCLANGRGKAAEFLARRGARLDLEGAAGVGNLELLKSFFNENGSLKGNASKKQMMSGFAWACEFGRTNVVEFLLQHGVKVDARLKHNRQTGLHWAAYSGHYDLVKLLLERKAVVNIKDESFGGTALGWALYGWAESPPEAKNGRYYEVVASLVNAGATVDPAWLANPDREMPIPEKVAADHRMVAALRGEL